MLTVMMMWDVLKGPAKLCQWLPVHCCKPRSHIGQCDKCTLQCPGQQMQTPCDVLPFNEQTIL